ncbi:MAG: AmmeMemoRadiSam system protein B [Nitrospirota bacterium]
MKTTKTIILLLLLIFLCPLAAGCAEQVKEPAVAGEFYPSDRKSLQEMVNGFLSKTEKVGGDGKLIVLVSPHAGYIYSGQVAAYGYRQIQSANIRNVIIIGASHRAPFNGASVYTDGSFRTPLGDVKINEKLARSFLNESAEVKFYPEAYEKEHSIEVQIPFLQAVLKDFQIVPILVGSLSRETFEHLITRLSDTVDENTLVVASTDLSHYHDYQTAKEMDSRMIAALATLSVGSAVQLLKTGDAEMCGSLPVIIAMETARRAGANLGSIFRYANSGDVTADKERVVGYASIGLYRSPYSNEERKELLSLARNAVNEHVINGKEIDPEMRNPKLRTDGAVFVTIKENGSLRGCIGHVRPVMPLYQSVIKNAVAASSSDPRFPPLKKEELSGIDMEISVLSPLRPVKDAKEIEVGRHGLVIRRGLQSGLLLPQVASENGWDRETFLDQLCVKAGLPKGAWKDAELYSFTAEIIR